MIEVRELVKSFGDHTVLKSLDLTVADGECVAVMGSSGGGKTTFLRCIAGLLPMTSGTVLVNGISIAEEPDAVRREMGMVFQSAALFDSLTVADNVLFGVRRERAIPPRMHPDLLRETLSRVGLGGTERQMPSELSGGMRKRLGLARALALSPKVLLYDEPTTGLDPLTTYQIDGVIDDVRRRLNVTSLVVSHDLMSVRRIANRVAFLHGGEMIFLGTPDAFVASPLGPIRELVMKTEATRFLDAG